MSWWWWVLALVSQVGSVRWPAAGGTSLLADAAFLCAVVALTAKAVRRAEGLK